MNQHKLFYDPVNLIFELINASFLLSLTAKINSCIEKLSVLFILPQLIVTYDSPRKERTVVQIYDPNI